MTAIRRAGMLLVCGVLPWSGVGCSISIETGSPSVAVVDVSDDSDDSASLPEPTQSVSPPPPATADSAESPPAAQLATTAAPAPSVPAQSAATPSAVPTPSAAAASVPFTPKNISDDPQVTLDLSFDDIKFDMVKGGPFERKLIRADIERYQDRRIRIRGYILPGFQERGIREFVLVRDNLECCFGPGAALYDCILVTMTGEPIKYTIRPITVEGNFSIEPFAGPDGYPLAIYRMQAGRAE